MPSMPGIKHGKGWPAAKVATMHVDKIVPDAFPALAIGRCSTWQFEEVSNAGNLSAGLVLLSYMRVHLGSRESLKVCSTCTHVYTCRTCAGWQSSQKKQPRLLSLCAAEHSGGRAKQYYTCLVDMVQVYLYQIIDGCSPPEGDP